MTFRGKENGCDIRKPSEGVASQGAIVKCTMFHEAFDSNAGNTLPLRKALQNI